ncbi:MAG: hypothetical protein AAF806_03335, partial [Bacteroidota bacterium]
RTLRIGKLYQQFTFLFARHANISNGLQEALRLNRQEVNATATASGLLAAHWKCLHDEQTKR